MQPGVYRKKSALDKINNILSFQTTQNQRENPCVTYIVRTNSSRDLGDNYLFTFKYETIPIFSCDLPSEKSNIYSKVGLIFHVFPQMTKKIVYI